MFQTSQLKRRGVKSKFTAFPRSTFTHLNGCWVDWGGELSRGKKRLLVSEIGRWRGTAASRPEKLQRRRRLPGGAFSFGLPAYCALSTLSVQAGQAVAAATHRAHDWRRLITTTREKEPDLGRQKNWQAKTNASTKILKVCLSLLNGNSKKIECDIYETLKESLASEFKVLCEYSIYTYILRNWGKIRNGQLEKL